MNYRIEDLEITLARLRQEELRASVARGRLIAQIARQRRDTEGRLRWRRALGLPALAIGRTLAAAARAVTRPQPLMAQRRDCA